MLIIIVLDLSKGKCHIKFAKKIRLHVEPVQGCFHIANFLANETLKLPHSKRVQTKQKLRGQGMIRHDLGP